MVHEAGEESWHHFYHQIVHIAHQDQQVLILLENQGISCDISDYNSVPTYFASNTVCLIQLLLAGSAMEN